MNNVPKRSPAISIGAIIAEYFPKSIFSTIRQVTTGKPVSLPSRPEQPER
jgi:hypothetical protein